MTDSIYAAPKADLTRKGEKLADGAFYVVSLNKLTVLFLLTLGMYQIYWNFKNWDLYRNRSKYEEGLVKGVWPVPRSLFPQFFTHSLFYKVQDHATANSRALVWNIDTNATLVVFLTIIVAVSSRLFDKEIGSPYTGMVVVVSIVLTMFAYRSAQRQINAACGDPLGRSNQHYTPANWAWIVTGGILITLIVIGLTMSPEQT